MTHLPWIVAALACALALIAGVAWLRARTRASRRTHLRQRRAAAGESEAGALLHLLGYEVVERQATARWELSVDGQSCPVHSRADFLVQRRGRLFVAEVKTGATAPDPTRPATRRQLLEYSLAFPVAGVLLVDMELGVVREVRFPLLRARPAR